MVLTKWNIGDVMYGPRQQVASVSDVITAVNRSYSRAVRDLDNEALRKAAGSQIHNLEVR